MDTVIGLCEQKDMNQEASPKKGKANPTYTEEFKRSVVDHWCNSDKTAEQVAGEFGVKVWNVRDWRRRYGITVKPVDAPMPQSPQEMNREIQQLRRELARVTMQRDILKKTMAIISET
jgi:transposase